MRVNPCNSWQFSWPRMLKVDEDRNRSLLLLTRESCNFSKIFRCLGVSRENSRLIHWQGRLGAHASRVHPVSRNLVHAGSVRSQGSSPMSGRLAPNFHACAVVHLQGHEELL